MIIGKVEKVIVMKVYDQDGKFLGEQAEYIYKPVLMWRDLIAGLLIAFVVGAQIL